MKTLTEEQINVAICEWLGYTFGRTDRDAEQCWRLGWRLDGKYVALLPSHTTDLNVMHAAEKRLLNNGKLGKLFGQYQAELRKVTDQPYHNDCHATALQRATALLRVVKPELFQ